MTATDPGPSNDREHPIDEGYEFLDQEGEVIGRLVWIDEASDAHEVAGWWLIDVADKPDEALYRVPVSLADSLPSARADGESGALWFARQITDDVRDGLLTGSLSTPAERA